MDQITPNTQTSLHISEEVLSTVVNEAIREIDGVGGLANLPASVTLFARPAAVKPVRIRLNADVAEIDVGITLHLNSRVKDVSEEVQSAVKAAIQNMTGVAVSKVNVYVAGVQTKESE